MGHVGVVIVIEVVVVSVLPHFSTILLEHVTVAPIPTLESTLGREGWTLTSALVSCFMLDFSRLLP